MSSKNNNRSHRPQPKDIFTNHKVNPARAMYEDMALESMTAREIDNEEQLDAHNLRRGIYRKKSKFHQDKLLAYVEYPRLLENLSKRLHHISRLIISAQKRQSQIQDQIINIKYRADLQSRCDVLQASLTNTEAKLQKLEEEKEDLEREYSEIQHKQSCLDEYLRSTGLQREKQLDRDLHVLYVVKNMSTFHAPAGNRVK
jgi:chromosome segregation ATPase